MILQVHHIALILFLCAPTVKHASIGFTKGACILGRDFVLGGRGIEDAFCVIETLVLGYEIAERVLGVCHGFVHEAAGVPEAVDVLR